MCITKRTIKYETAGRNTRLNRIITNKNKAKMKTNHIFLILTILMFSNLSQSQNLSDTIRLKIVEVSDTAIKRKAYIKAILPSQIIKSSSTRDVGDYLRSVPNVGGIRKGGGSIDPVIRGYKYSQINVVIDGGMKIENGCPNRMDPATSHTELEELSHIEIVKGPYMLGYGPALGGTINLETEKPVPFEKFEIHGKASFGYESNWNGGKEHFELYGGNKKVYFRASGGYREYGDYQSGNKGAEAVTYNTSFRKFNYGAKLGWAITRHQNVLLNYSEVHGRDVMFPALAMDEVSDDTRMLSADYSYKHTTGALKSVDVKIYQTDVQHLMDNSNRETWKTRQMIADVNATNRGAKATANWNLKNRDLYTGIDFEHIYKDGVRTMKMQMMGTTSVKKFNLWKDAEIYNFGVFGNYSVDIAKFNLDAGLRIDLNQAFSEDTLKIIKNNIEYFNQTHSNFMNLSANIGLTRNISKNLTASVSLARASRSPNMLERYIKLLSVGYDTYDYLGNPQLKPEINNEIDVTLKYQNETLGGFYMNGFYSLVQDYISSVLIPNSVLKPATIGAPGVKQFVNVKYAIFKGFEAGYTSPSEYKLGVNIIAAYTHSSLPETLKYIVKEGTVVGDTLIKNDAVAEIPPFEATASVSYKLLKGKLIPKVSVRMVAAQKRISQAFYEQETPGFSIINFAMTYKINTNVEITAGVNNLLDKAYYEHLNRKIIGTTNQLFEPGRVMYVNLFLAL